MAAEFAHGSDQVRVQGFGPLRPLLPAAVAWREGTVQAFHAHLADACPAAAPWLPSCLTIVDGEPLPTAIHRWTPVRAGSRVELLPPVSGG